MFIYFVDLVESKFFFEFWSLFFGFCGQRSVPTQRATVHLHCLDSWSHSWRAVVCCWCWYLLLGLDMGGSVPSSTERCRVALFEMKFDPWKKSKEECNSSRRSATPGATLSEEHSDRRETKSSGIRLNFSRGSGKGLEQKTSVC